MTSFAGRLRQEFEARKAKNAKYSLRAFANLLGVDHATLCQILRQTRPMPVGKIGVWANRLGLDGEEARAYVLAAHVPDDATVRRQQQLRQWSAEALAIVTDRIHFEILRMMRLPGFCGDSRWIAAQAGATVDEVNVALQRLLRLRLLAMETGHHWRDLTGLAELDDSQFRRLALERVRMLARPN